MGVTLPPLEWRESPNQSQRLFPDDVELIIVHTPEGSYPTMLNFLCRESSQVSYHLLLREDGEEATQLVAWSRKAWHAKVHNSRSEGISAAGYAADFDPNSEQAKRLARIVAFRLHKRGLPARWSTRRGFCRHADLQSDRRDPCNRTKWIRFVARVKYEKARGRFRETWGKTW